MAEKTKINAYINTKLAEEFRQVARLSYGQIGLCLSAAMLQFLESASDDQVAFIKRVFEAEEDGTIDQLIAGLKEMKQPGNAKDSKKK
jgi:hypothetical protein